jgi:pyruvate formate lyase activating enzyme
LQEGYTQIPIEDVIAKIKTAGMVTTGVVFSGGEPCVQTSALFEMAHQVKKMGMGVGIHTSGISPFAILGLLDTGDVDKIAIDFKMRLGDGVQKPYELMAYRALGLCKDALDSDALKEFELVFTMYQGDEERVVEICKSLDHDQQIVLNQGTPYRQPNGQDVQILSFDELKVVGKRIGCPVSIRTREHGQVDV